MSFFYLTLLRVGGLSTCRFGCHTDKFDNFHHGHALTAANHGRGVVGVFGMDTMFTHLIHVDCPIDAFGSMVSKLGREGLG